MTDAMKNRSWKRWKLCAGILLLCAVLGMSIYYGVTVSNAATITVGTVATNSSPLSVRKGPGTSYTKIGSLTKGSQVTIIGEEGDWYKILFGTGEGYVSKTYISDVHTVEENPPDENYIQWLVDQGFPTSYAEKLAVLHSKYPNWKFEPVLTGLDWNTVIEKESELGTNLVQSRNDDSQKSTEKGAYNWSTNTWIGFDGSGWVCASREMIEYCMDPRNFLTAANIFQFSTNEYKEYQNVAGVQALLNGTFMSGNYNNTEPDGEVKNYAQTFVEVGASIGVNPYHLAARCRQEQGVNGTSNSISGTVNEYKNVYNYFHIGAYPHDGRNSVENGLIYARSKGWTTRYISILEGSKIVGNNYVKKGQNTVYFQKFNVVNKTSGLYTHQYMTNVQAAISEGISMKKAYTDMDVAIVFRIPVYENMPATAMTLPSSGNPNNWIKALNVDTYELTPAFSPATTEYSLIVDENVSSVMLKASAVASTSSVSGTGRINLNYGNNAITVKCTAQDKSVRTYTLNVVRQTPETPEEPETPTINRGDVNQDGKISNADIVYMERYMLGLITLSDEKKLAADVNQDGKVSNADIVLVEKHILGLTKIQ